MTEGLTFADRACYLEASETLVVADLHIGLGASSAVTMPIGEREALLSRLEALLERFDPRRVVFAGDVLHAFDTVPSGVRQTLDAIRDLILGGGASLEVTSGNHDTQLDGLGLEVPIAESRSIAATTVCHGHERPSVTADRYVIGHEHPTIEIEGQRFPCSLVGPGPKPDTEVVVLPALTPLARGTLVNGLENGDTLSPLVVEPGSFRPIVTHGEATHRFPPLDKLRRHL